MLQKTISGRYKLYKQQELLGQSSSKKGLYTDKKTGKLVFIKMDTNGKLLSREHRYQQFFYEQSKKLRATGVIVPKPLEILTVGNYTALVMEYYPAKSILETDVKTRLDVYMKVLKFLEKINSMTSGKKSDLRRKSASQQFITFPYFLSKNLRFYISHTPLFIQSIILIIKLIPQWMKLKSDWICHGDINVTNILISGRKVIILDFACANTSHRYFDISRALNSTWYQGQFHRQLWSRIISELGFSKQQQSILKSFVIFNLMQRLSQRYTNSNQERFYLERLKILTNPYGK